MIPEEKAPQCIASCTSSRTSNWVFRVSQDADISIPSAEMAAAMQKSLACNLMEFWDWFKTANAAIAGHASSKYRMLDEMLESMHAES